jgi:hypothetical protein
LLTNGLHEIEDPTAPTKIEEKEMILSSFKSGMAELQL